MLNKIDLTNQEKLEELYDKWKQLIPRAEIFPISATENFNVDNLYKRIIALLPEGEPFFPKDELTDLPARFFVTEIIREKILLNYEKEVPYSVEVEVEEFKEDPKRINIMAVIYVERDSQKGIIIGKQGEALKKVGTEARLDIEAFFGKKFCSEPLCQSSERLAQQRAGLEKLRIRAIKKQGQAARTASVSAGVINVCM